MHSFRPHPPLHRRLSLKREWEKPRDITFEDILYEPERDRHKETFTKFKHKLCEPVGASCVYLTAKGDERSRLEAQLRKTLDFVPAVVKTQLAFAMPGSTKLEGD